MPVPEYHLWLEPDDWQWFRKHPGSERCFPARLSHAEGQLDAWIAYRGRFSRDFPKPSYDIWLQSGLLEGRKQLHLNAAYRDPSLLRGRLALAVFGDLDVLVPRAWHIWLTINGQPQGLFTAIEPLDGDWMGRYGGGGSIYYSVGGEGNFGLISRKKGTPKRRLGVGWEKCYPADDDMSDLEDLVYRITLPTDAEFEVNIGTVLDVEKCLRWLVGIVFMGHTDGLVHNFALLRRPDRLWELSPWDCDGTWGRTPYGSLLGPQEIATGDVSDNYLAVRLLASPLWRQRYHQLWSELLEGPLAPERIDGRLRMIYSEIRAAGLQDAQKWLSNSTFTREPGAIRRWVLERAAYIRRELADPSHLAADGSGPTSR